MEFYIKLMCSRSCLSAYLTGDVSSKVAVACFFLSVFVVGEEMSYCVLLRRRLRALIRFIDLQNNETDY